MDINQISPNDSHEDLSSSSPPPVGDEEGFFGVELLRIIDGRSFSHDAVNGTAEQIFIFDRNEQRRIPIPLRLAPNSIFRGVEVGNGLGLRYETNDSIDIIMEGSDHIENEYSSEEFPVFTNQDNSDLISVPPLETTSDPPETHLNVTTRNSLPFAIGDDIEDDEDDEDFILNADETDDDEEADNFLTDPASESESDQAPSIRLLAAFSDNRQLDSDYSSSSYIPSPDSQDDEHDMLSLSSDSDSDSNEMEGDLPLVPSVNSGPRGGAFRDINYPIMSQFNTFSDKEKILRVAIDGVSIREKSVGSNSERSVKELYLGPGKRLTPQLLAEISSDHTSFLSESVHDSHSRFAVNPKRAIISNFFIKLFPRGKVLDIGYFYGSKNDKIWHQSRFFGASFLRPNSHSKVKSSGIIKERVKTIRKPSLRRPILKNQRCTEKDPDVTGSLSDAEEDTRLATTKEIVYRFDTKTDNSLVVPTEVKELVDKWNLQPARKSIMYYNRLDIPQVPNLAKSYIQSLTRDSSKSVSDPTLHQHLLERELTSRPKFLHPKLSQGLIPSEIGRAHKFYDSRLYSGQFSRDGSLFVNGSADFLVKVYDTDETPEYPVLKCTIKATHGRWALTDTQISPNNKLIAISSLAPAIQINTVPEDLQTKDYEDYDYDNDRYYSNSYKYPKPQSPHFLPLDSETSFIYLLDRPSRSASFASVFAIKFSNDSRRLVSAGSLNTIQDTDIEYDKPITKLWGHESDVNALDWLDKSCQKLISGDDDGYIKLWDLRTGEKPMYLMGHTEGITSLEAHENETLILSNSKDQTLKLFDIRSAVSHSAMANETLDNYNTGFDYRGEIYPGTVKGRHPLDSSIMTYQGHSVLRTLIRAHFSPYQSTGSKYIYSGSADGGVYIWKLDGTPVRRLEVQKSFKYSSELNEFYKNDDRTLPESYQRVGRYSTTLRNFKSCLTRDAAWHPRLPIIISSSWVHDDSLDQFSSFGSFNSENEESEDDINIVFSPYARGCMMVHEYNQRAPFTGKTFDKVQRKTKFSDIAPNSEFIYNRECTEVNDGDVNLDNGGNSSSVLGKGYFGF